MTKSKQNNKNKNNIDAQLRLPDYSQLIKIKRGIK